MNSEISNIAKTSPVTIVNVDKKAEARADSSTANTDLQPQLVNLNEANPSTEKSKNESKPPAAEQVQKAIDQGNSLLQAVRRNLHFKVDNSTKELIVQIVDSDNGDVVRQIPSEEMLAFIKRLQDLEGQQGSMIQDRA